MASVLQISILLNLLFRTHLTSDTFDEGTSVPLPCRFWIICLLERVLTGGTTHNSSIVMMLLFSISRSKSSSCDGINDFISCNMLKFVLQEVRQIEHIGE